ncbi:hypothetical protein BpHYR1_016763 [Brachionus plicatilis]|uniref:Uncharacterized protein n=1 Tax=Brachionus plicatilis TaxID=10195 RepID=A0A3M7SNN2_BRAPC|nr:hypothetical protein BpHYR1_016763 [Brachionus plicatilis]
MNITIDRKVICLNSYILDLIDLKIEKGKCYLEKYDWREGYPNYKYCILGNCQMPFYCADVEIL